MEGFITQGEGLGETEGFITTALGALLFSAKCFISYCLISALNALLFSAECFTIKRDKAVSKPSPWGRGTACGG